VVLYAVGIRSDFTGHTERRQTDESRCNRNLEIDAEKFAAILARDLERRVKVVKASRLHAD
jgi:hypothetical protein